MLEVVLILIAGSILSGILGGFVYGIAIKTIEGGKDDENE